MSQWDEDQKISLPGRRPVWTISCILFGIAMFGALVVYQIQYQWSPLQRFYLRAYVGTGIMPSVSASHYRLVFVFGKHRSARLGIDQSFLDLHRNLDGSATYVLSTEAMNSGIQYAALVPGIPELPNTSGASLHYVLQRLIYQGQPISQLFLGSQRATLEALLILFPLAVYLDSKRRLKRQDGQFVRGAELVTVREFNRRCYADGVGLRNRDQSWLEAKLCNVETAYVRIPREEEKRFAMIIGDSGSGKTAAIFSLMMEAQSRGERAIVLDCAMEFLPRFYTPERGDIILQPWDKRAPRWTVSSEIQHPAEASSIAKSLFPEDSPQDRFFMTWTRQILAHILSMQPTNEELARILCNEQELEKLLANTTMLAAIKSDSPNQRNGILGTLNMFGGILRMLPGEAETTQTWSAASWAKSGKGWLFLPAPKTFREQLNPLYSLWLDTLILRLTNNGESDLPKTWLFLDELASLQTLPQLHTAITEGRKSGHPIVLGFQGRSQMYDTYGQKAEAMMSQPATKIFLKTSSPEAAEWISSSIGEQERAYIRESYTHGISGQQRTSMNEQIERKMKRLVLASQISGLAPLHGYIKHGNLVVPIHFPYIAPSKRHEAFIPREVALNNPKIKEVLSLTESALEQPDEPASKRLFYS